MMLLTPLGIFGLLIGVIAFRANPENRFPASTALR